MKVMTYNILRGGFDGAAGCDRLDAIQRVIEGCAPDVLALQEANRFDTGGLLPGFADALGLPYFALSEAPVYEDGERYHGALLSRYPLRDVHAFPEGTFLSAALSALVETPLGPLSVCSVHLHSYSEDERLKELAHVLAHQAGFRDQILLGDFNSLSRSDDFNQVPSEVEVRFEVTDRLKQDYVDLLHVHPGAAKPTFPTALGVEHWPNVSARIDYLFASPHIAERVRSAVVVDSAQAQRASDHFPLCVEFDDAPLAEMSDKQP